MGWEIILTSERPSECGTHLFPETSSLSLPAPPSATPLRGKRAFGPSLSGIPYPSLRPGRPPPSAREQSRTSLTKRNTYTQKRPDRHGRIKAAVWENEADRKKFYNVTFARTYIDDAKNYHDTDSFGRDDLPLVAKLADQAHTFIFDRLAELKSEQSE